MTREPTFIAKPPTKPGWYLWQQYPNIDVVRVAEVQQDEHLLITLVSECSCAKGDPRTLGGLWCRLVPAEEVEKAYKEGWMEGFACDGQATYGFDGQKDMDFEKSRAKRVMEGEV